MGRFVQGYPILKGRTEVQILSQRFLIPTDLICKTRNVEKTLYPIGTKLIHGNRGPCIFSAQCAKLQEQNPDPTSIFVELDGDIVEVSKVWVKPL